MGGGGGGVVEGGGEEGGGEGLLRSDWAAMAYVRLRRRRRRRRRRQRNGSVEVPASECVCEGEADWGDRRNKPMTIHFASRAQFPRSPSHHPRRSPPPPHRAFAFVPVPIARPLASPAPSPSPSSSALSPQPTACSPALCFQGRPTSDTDPTEVRLPPAVPRGASDACDPGRRSTRPPTLSSSCVHAGPRLSYSGLRHDAIPCGASVKSQVRVSVK